MKRTSLAILFFLVTLVSACSQSDGSYCAEVKRYNPNTLKESAYTLIVDVKDDRLVRIYWPNGGYTDKSDFEPPKISNDVTSFKTYNNVQYSVKLIKPGTDCFEGELRQCTGMTV